ncbi:cysteine-tRNA ligase-like, partial [Trifolium medium]|nr:cysteine-tRNA ligase-like [Trifolium medium]
MSLLKCYKPFYSSMFFFHSSRPAVFPGYRAAVFRKKNFPPFRAVSSSSHPLTPENNSSSSESFSSKSSPEVFLHNTMSKKKELFKPRVESKVGMYVCGVTAYDHSHIGHARVYVNFDLLYRSQLT